MALVEVPVERPLDSLTLAWSVSRSSCPVVLEPLDAAIAGLQRAARDPETAGAFAGVKHVVMRAGIASTSGVLSLTTERRSPAISRCRGAISKYVVGGISTSYELSNANAVIGRKMDFVWGEREMEETIEGVRFRVSPASFFQINGEMVAAIFRALGELLGAQARVVDLYCGAGTFAIFFAARGARVVGIEENGAAVAEARRNAALNGVEDRGDPFKAGSRARSARGRASRRCGTPRSSSSIRRARGATRRRAGVLSRRRGPRDLVPLVQPRDARA